MTTDELKQLESLLGALMEEQGPAPFFWAMSRIVETTAKDKKQAAARSSYAEMFFRNRAKVLLSDGAGPGKDIGDAH